MKLKTKYWKEPEYPCWWEDDEDISISSKLEFILKESDLPFQDLIISKYVIGARPLYSEEREDFHYYEDRGLETGKIKDRFITWFQHYGDALGRLSIEGKKSRFDVPLAVINCIDLMGYIRKADWSSGKESSFEEKERSLKEQLRGLSGKHEEEALKLFKELYHNSKTHKDLYKKILLLTVEQKD